MSIHGLTNIRKALTSLNPRQVREDSERPVRINIHAPDADGYRRMESYFLQTLHDRRRDESAMLLSRGSGSGFGNTEDINIFDERLSTPPGALIFHPQEPHMLVQRVLDKYPDSGISLARHFQPFRKPFVSDVIKTVSRDNTLFSLTTALPDVIPSIIELPWAVAEFASDSAFLTMNQVRMAFLIAAASDREIGYMEQKSEIAAVIGSAFGWRALARQVVGKIPFGGGLIGKAAIAYAGTRVLGLSLDRYYSLGYAYDRDERKKLYQEAYENGKRVAQKLVSTLNPDLARRLSAHKS